MWHPGVVEGIVVEQVVGEPEQLRELLANLDARHRLRDSQFAAPHRLADGTDPRVIRLVAVRADHLEGFLAGTPRTGHIALVGVLHEGGGVGTALIDAFARRSRALAAREITVVLDTEPHGRWRRRAFFHARGFSASPGSNLHFHRRL